jgi:hypothetical protein
MVRALRPRTRRMRYLEPLWHRQPRRFCDHRESHDHRPFWIPSYHQPARGVSARSLLVPDQPLAHSPRRQSSPPPPPPPPRRPDTPQTQVAAVHAPHRHSSIPSPPLKHPTADISSSIPDRRPFKRPHRQAKCILVSATSSQACIQRQTAVR